MLLTFSYKTFGRVDAGGGDGQQRSPAGSGLPSQQGKSNKK